MILLHLLYANDYDYFKALECLSICSDFSDMLGEESNFANEINNYTTNLIVEVIFSH